MRKELVIDHHETWPVTRHSTQQVGGYGEVASRGTGCTPASCRGSHPRCQVPILLQRGRWGWRGRVRWEINYKTCCMVVGLRKNGAF
jgi:hypothetical protein